MHSCGCVSDFEQHAWNWVKYPKDECRTVTSITAEGCGQSTSLLWTVTRSNQCLQDVIHSLYFLNHYRKTLLQNSRINFLGAKQWGFLKSRCQDTLLCPQFSALGRPALHYQMLSILIKNTVTTLSYNHQRHWFTRENEQFVGPSQWHQEMGDSPFNTFTNFRPFGFLRRAASWTKTPSPRLQLPSSANFTNLGVSPHTLLNRSSCGLVRNEYSGLGSCLPPCSNIACYLAVSSSALGFLAEFCLGESTTNLFSVSASSSSSLSSSVVPSTMEFSPEEDLLPVWHSNNPRYFISGAGASRIAFHSLTTNS